MKRRYIASMMIVSASIFVVGITPAAQDRFTLKSPNGIAFSEFKGYDKWQMVASSQPDDASGCGTATDPGCIKAILGNPVMIRAYRDGIPANGKSVPDGAKIAIIEWQKNPAQAYGVTVPGTLAEVSFMVKNSKRFPDTNGWGWATFRYDAASDTSGRSATARRSRRRATGAIRPQKRATSSGRATPNGETRIRSPRGGSRLRATTVTQDADALRIEVLDEVLSVAINPSGKGYEQQP